MCVCVCVCVQALLQPLLIDSSQDLKYCTVFEGLLAVTRIPDWGKDRQPTIYATTATTRIIHIKTAAVLSPCYPVMWFHSKYWGTITRSVRKLTRQRQDTHLVTSGHSLDTKTVSGQSLEV